MAEDAEPNVRPDFSLRADGASYIDRFDESERILSRIQNSSSSVIGISGVRGAGKSSLSQKILMSCENQGYFSLSIPSPTSYEPREFLLTIFQRIAEHSADKVRILIDGEQNLEATAKFQSLRLSRRLWLAVIGLMIFVVATFGAASYSLWNYEEEIKSREYQNRIVEEKMYLNRKKSELSASLRELDTKISNAAKQNNADIDKMKSDRTTEQRELDDVSQEIANFDQSKYLPYTSAILTSSTLYGTTFALILAVGFYPVLIAAGAYISRLRRRRKVIKNYPKESGLYFEALQVMELIKYQTTRSENRDVGFSWTGLTGRLAATRQLVERPLSLPGLTASCSDYMAKIASVFSGKIVICIDELDKITDLPSFIELLKGIKGILGQKDSHFLLTISEDAVAQFTRRLSGDRNLIESSFEEVVYLDRVPRHISFRMIAKAAALKEEAFDTAGRAGSNATLLWGFGAGVPREIKRNLFLCHAASLEVASAEPYAIWRVLYVALLTAMLSESSDSSATIPEGQYLFLILAEEILQLIQTTKKTDSRKIVKDVLGVMRKKVGDILELPLGNKDTEKYKNSVSFYLPMIMEMIIGLLLLAVVSTTARGKTPHDVSDSIIYIYKFVPVNPLYALYGLQQFLRTRLSYLQSEFEFLTSINLISNPLPVDNITALDD